MLSSLAGAMEILDADRMDEIMLDISSHTFGEEIDSLTGKLLAAVKDMDEELAGRIINEIEGKTDI